MLVHGVSPVYGLCIGVFLPNSAREHHWRGGKSFPNYIFQHLIYVVPAVPLLLKPEIFVV